MINIFYLDKVDTTMKEVKKYPPNSLVVANEQTNGRGKDDRIWQSAKSNNIYASLLLETENSKINYSNYTFLTSLAVAKTTIRLTNNQAKVNCKWPNDVLLNNKKFCGILLERDILNNTLVIGFGVNIDHHPNIVDKVAFDPTDLLTEGFTIDRKQFIENFVNIFDALDKEFQVVGFEKIRNEWLSFAYNFGKTITAKIKDKEFEGIFEELDKDGTLILNTKNGRIRILSADVF